MYLGVYDFDSRAGIAIANLEPGIHAVEERFFEEDVGVGRAVHRVHFRILPILEQDGLDLLGRAQYVPV